MLLLAAVLAGGSAAEPLPSGAVVIDPQRVDGALGMKSAQRATQAFAALQRGDVGAATRILQEASSALEAEWAADQVLQRLETEPPNESGRRWLAWAAAQPPRVFRRHDETVADWFLPHFNIAARAEGLLAQWARADARDACLDALTQAPTQLPKVDAPGLAQQGCADAVAGLDDAALAVLRDAALAMPTEVVPSLWQALAERAPDSDVLVAALRYGDAAARLAVIRLAADRLPPAQSIAVLDHAAEQPELASAATLALAPLATTEPAALERLARRLGDTQLGPSAAAALARLPTPDRVKRIEALWSQAKTAGAREHLLLALDLEGSAEARALRMQWRRQSAPAP